MLTPASTLDDEVFPLIPVKEFSPLVGHKISFSVEFYISKHISYIKQKLYHGMDKLVAVKEIQNAFSFLLSFQLCVFLPSSRTLDTHTAPQYTS